MRSTLLLLGALIFAGCVRAGSQSTTATSTAEHCELELTLQPLTTGDRCDLDVEVSAGRLRLPCDGTDGPAEAKFGERIFTGSIVNRIVTVEIVTSFDYDDRCQWQSRQRISGEVFAGDLAFSYSEAPLPNQTGCSPACGAQGLVSVGH